MKRLRENSAKSHHLLVMQSIFIVLIAIYMLTYASNLTANDELMMLNVTASQVRFQDRQYDLALWYSPATNWFHSDLYPLNKTNIDPFQMIAAMPLYWIAYQLPGFGLVHTVWLFNVIVSALSGVLMYGYALVLGYSERTAIASAICLGLLTGLWVYSQTFFREPLALCLFLLSLLLVELWQQAYFKGKKRRGITWLALSMIAALLMILTKASLISIVPALVIFAVPFPTHWQGNKHFRFFVGLVIIALVVFAILVAFSSIIEAVVPESAIRVGGYSVNTRYTQEALHSYFFSIGGSIWGTSPVLLLAIPGAWMLWRQKRDWRYLALTLVGLLSVGLAYALLRSHAWFGGASWPPRFLIPLLPLPLLLSLPVFELFFHNQLPRWISVSIILIGLYSLWWQVSGVLFRNGTYSRLLPAESNELADWLPGLNTLQYLRPVVLTKHFLSGDLSVNSLWLRTQSFGAPLVYLSVLVMVVWLMWHRPFYKQWKQMAWTILLLFLGIVWGLRSSYSDPRYFGDNQALHDAVNVLKHETRPHDVVILNDPTYHEFFLNYGKVDNARFVTLAAHPGERGSFEQELQVVSDNPRELMSRGSPQQIEALAQQRDRLWILMETGPFLPWSIRPVERFMVESYFPLREVALTPTVRLLEFATGALSGEAIEPVAVDSTLRFGQSIHLEQIELPLGLTYQPGDALPLSLFWRTDGPIEDEFTVAVFLVNQANRSVLVQGWDSPPAFGFAPTNTWVFDEVIKDNRAISVPHDLPDGDYDLWVRLYRFQVAELVTLPVTGEHVPDMGGDTAVLPVTIHIGS